MLEGNLDKEKNVVIAETTTKTKNSTSNKKKTSEEKKYKEYIDKIFEGSIYAKSSYNKKAYAALKFSLNYLNENIGHLICETYKTTEEPAVQALKDVVAQWPHFIESAEKFNNAYNIPSQPQPRFIKVQIRV